MTKIRKAILQFILKLFAIAAACFALFVLYFILLMLLDWKVYLASLVFPAALLLVAAAWLLPWKKARKGTLIGAASVAIAGVICVCAMLGYNAYLDSIRIIDNLNINTEEYLPFDENSKIARLDSEASLRFSPLDDLPIIDGASALFPLYSSFVNATYPSNIPPLNREDSPFRYHNTSGGYAALIEGEIDLMVGVAPDEGTLRYAEECGVSFTSVPIGKEAFVFFTNAKNDVESLTVEQIRMIYSGQITNWKEVGGDDLEIQVFLRNGNSGSGAALEALMDGLPVTATKTEYVFDLMSGIVEAASDYENHRGAIGFSFRYYVTDIVSEDGIRFIPIEGVEPDIRSLSSGEYPLIHEFYMTYRTGECTPEMQRLIDWALSDEGQTLVERSGYAPLH